MGLKIGDIAYLREPEGGHNAGIVSQMGGGHGTSCFLR